MAVRPPRIFLLSPANCNGRRGAQVLSPQSKSEAAQRLRSTDGIPLGDLFSFVSGLYFRGKLTYARHFAAPPDVDNPVVGRGDMSRGGLLLRQAAADVELTYVPIAGAVRHGPRPPKLSPQWPNRR